MPDHDAVLEVPSTVQYSDRASRSVFAFFGADGVEMDHGWMVRGTDFGISLVEQVDSARVSQQVLLFLAAMAVRPPAKNGIGRLRDKRWSRKFYGMGSP